MFWQTGVCIIGQMVGSCSLKVRSHFMRPILANVVCDNIMHTDINKVRRYKGLQTNVLV